MRLPRGLRSVPDRALVAYRLIEEGKSRREVAAELGVSLSAVVQWLAAIREHERDLALFGRKQ